jgi:hypothetical protein
MFAAQEIAQAIVLVAALATATGFAGAARNSGGEERMRPVPVSILIAARETPFRLGKPSEILVFVTNIDQDRLLLETFGKHLGMFVLDFTAEETQLSRPHFQVAEMPPPDYRGLAPGETWIATADLRDWLPKSAVPPSPLHLQAHWDLDRIAKGPVERTRHFYKGRVSSDVMRLHFDSPGASAPEWGRGDGFLQSRIFPAKRSFKTNDRIVLYAEFRLTIEKPKTTWSPHLLLPKKIQSGYEGIEVKVWDSAGKLLTFPPFRKSGHLDVHDIPPIDAVFQKEVDLTDWLAQKPGAYSVELTFRGTTYETHLPRYGTGTTTSNRTAIVIEPMP